MTPPAKTAKAGAKSGHCKGCNATKIFSKNQWRKHANERRCSECVQAPKKAGAPEEKNDAKQKRQPTGHCHGCDSTKAFSNNQWKKYSTERRCVECLQRRSTSRPCRGCKVERRGPLLDNTDLCLVCIAWTWPWTPEEEEIWASKMAVVTDADRLYRGALAHVDHDRFLEFQDSLVDPVVSIRMEKRVRGIRIKELEEEFLRETLTRMCDGCRRPLAYDAIKGCGGCHAVEYHGPECQRRHWKDGHKEACKELRKVPEMVKLAKMDTFRERERLVEDLGLTVDSLFFDREEYLDHIEAGAFSSDDEEPELNEFGLTEGEMDELQEQFIKPWEVWEV